MGTCNIPLAIRACWGLLGPLWGLCGASRCLAGGLCGLSGLVWGLSGASCGQSGASRVPSPTNLPNKTSPANPSVRTGVRERLPHPRLLQQTFPNRTSPTNHTGRSCPHPFHKGERGGEVVDDPCQPLTHSDPFIPKGKGKGMATCHHLVVRPFPKRMDNATMPLPFPFGKEGERVSQRRTRIVDHFPSLPPCLERDGEMVGWWLGWVRPPLPLERH